MLIEQVDGVHAEPLQRGLGDLLDMRRPAVEPFPDLCPGRIDVEAELGGDHDLSPEGLKRLADEFLVDEGAIDFGGVEEGDAAFDSRPKKGDHLLPVGRWSISEAHSHAAEANGRDLKATASKFALLHRFWSLQSRSRVDQANSKSADGFYAEPRKLLNVRRQRILAFRCFLAGALPFRSGR